MRNNPIVSVVVTTFERRILLSKTIVSILNQSFNNFELIIVDNYSKYNISQLIKSFNDVRIKLYQNKNNGIISINRNYGVYKSNSDYIAFCDDDDVWYKDKLQSQMNIFKNNPDLLLNSTLALKKGYKSSIFEANFGILYRKYTLDKDCLIKLNPIIFSTVILKKSVFLKLNGFSESKDLVSVEDLDLWLRIMDIGKISILNEILINYLIHDNNTTNSFLNNRKKYLNKNGNNLKEYRSPFLRNNWGLFKLVLNSVAHSFTIFKLIVFKRINGLLSTNFLKVNFNEK
jgi:teichuronic acid biosynthesis glycosyltransferase TuaG